MTSLNRLTHPSRLPHPHCRFVARAAVEGEIREQIRLAEEIGIEWLRRSGWGELQRVVIVIVAPILSEFIDATSDKADLLVVAEIEHLCARVDPNQPCVIRNERQHLLFVDWHRGEGIPFVNPALIAADEIDPRPIPCFLPARGLFPKRCRRIEAEVNPLRPVSLRLLHLSGSNQVFVSRIATPVLRLCPPPSTGGTEGVSLWPPRGRGGGGDQPTELERRPSETDGGQFLHEKGIAEVCKKFVVKEGVSDPTFRP